jgi:hypothetical protein
MDHFLVTRRVSEEFQSAPRSRFGLPLRGTSALARESMGEKEKQRILVFDALKFG